MIIAYCDGACSGNPGPMGIGVVILRDGAVIREISESIGTGTNNIAEYKAVIFALKKAKQLLGKVNAKKTDLEIKVDSELLYKQMNGEYKILEPDLQQLFIEAWNLKQDFKSTKFIKIPREQNKEADKMVNQALDGKIANIEPERLL